MTRTRASMASEGVRRVFASRDGHASVIRGGTPETTLMRVDLPDLFCRPGSGFSGRDLQVNVDQGSHAGEAIYWTCRTASTGVSMGSFRVVPSRPVTVASVSGCPASARSPG